MDSYTYTSVEQSKKLVELGLDPATADLSWNSKKLDDPEFELQIGYNPALKFKLFSFRSGHVIPCWSIGRLMELIPDHIMHDGVNCWFGADQFGVRFVHNYSEVDKTAVNVVWGKNPDLIDAFYNCVVWLLEKKHMS